MPAPTSLRPGSIVRGPTLPEPVEVLALVPLGDPVKLIGRELQTGLTHDPVLTADQQAGLIVSADQEPFDGDALIVVNPEAGRNVRRYSLPDLDRNDEFFSNPDGKEPL